jgi:cytochrome c-type biogenesis protein
MRHRRDPGVSRRLLVGATVLVLAACGSRVAAGQAVAYRATALATGAPTDLADLRGSTVLLSSWATWCEPCREELPELQGLADRRRRDGLVVVAVNVDVSATGDGEVRAMAEDLGLTMPRWRDPGNRFARVFDGIGVPTNALVDADGRLVRVWQGPVDPDAPDFVRTLDRTLDSRRS